MSDTEAQREAKLRYKGRHVKQLNVPLFPRDEDIVRHLEGVPKKAEYVRALIRADMERGGAR